MQKLIIVTGNPETTISGNSTDAAQSLEDLGATIEYSNPAQQTRQANYAYISVEDADVRIGKGTISTSLGHIVDAGTSAELESAAEVQQFKIISAVAGAHATLQITIEFRD